MKRIGVVAATVLSLVVMTLSVTIAPDRLSLVFVGFMIVMMVIGIAVGMIPAMGMAIGFETARRNVKKIVDIQPNSPWLYVQQSESVFRQKTLDGMFGKYIEKAVREYRDGEVISDVEDVINEESLSLRCWNRFIQIIPGTLTAIGLTGTFVGLIYGISSIGFSSVDATINSIELMLTGIRTAFYTSIVGIVFSIIFNVMHRLTWNVTLREMGFFMEEFHLYVLPTADEQLRHKQDEDTMRVLNLLERLPRTSGYSIGVSNNERLSADVQNEQQFMADVQKGLLNGEFVFYVQPRCDLTTHEIVGGEALMRWNHSSMGMVSPVSFLPVLERNGYVARVDRYIWECVFMEIRKWIDEDKRPLPISINISKTDILTMDVPSFFAELVRKYHVAPKHVELEFASNAYLQSSETMRTVEKELRQKGFRVVVDGFTGDITALSVFKETEVDAIKLDMRHISYDPGRKHETVAAIAEQVNALHIPLVVEGVESAEELNMLRRCGFKEGQGYQLYKPMPINEFKKIAGGNQ